MSYITVANVKRIIEQTDIKSLDIQGDLYKRRIYFYNRFEKNRLLSFREFFKDAEKYFSQIYVQVHNVDSYKYVYEGHAPAYHKTLDCSKISSVYENYKIPAEIVEKGKEEVLKFRTWFKENKEHLDNPEVFVMRLKMRWGIETNPQAILYKNTGYHKLENYSIEELEEKIDDLLSESVQYYKANERNTVILKKYSRATFLAYKAEKLEDNDTGYSDKEIKEILQEYEEKYKRPLSTLLIEYYKVSLNPKLELNGLLLDALGFRRCSHCHKDIEVI
jgi:hypothetical protein